MINSENELVYENIVDNYDRPIVHNNETQVVNENGHKEPEYEVKKYEIRVKFETNSDNITAIVLATGQTIPRAKVASRKEVQLIHNRAYFIPINTDINSDDFSVIKIPSDIAGQLDIRYVKDGFAYIVPIINTIVLKDNDLLCTII